MSAQLSRRTSEASLRDFSDTAFGCGDGVCFSMLQLRGLQFTGSTEPTPTDDEGGYDTSLFQEEVSGRLICGVCLMVLREPQLIEECGHHFCRSCLERVRLTNGCCPIDRTDLMWTKVVLNKAIMREIEDLKVKCENSDRGCRWKGELRNFQAHKERGECRLICPNNCGCVVRLDQLDDHVNNRCREAVVSCPFKSVGEGCLFKAKRRNMDAHLSGNQTEHLLQAATACTQMQEHIWREACSPLTLGDRQTSFDWVIWISNLRNSLVQYKCSDEFYTGPCKTGYCLQLMAGLSRKTAAAFDPAKIMLYVRVCPGKNDDTLAWQFSYVVNLQLLHNESKQPVRSYPVRELSTTTTDRLHIRCTVPWCGATDRLHIPCIVPW